jgi:hypothetical protein
MLWRAKKAASARREVASQATALAPFSQNSKSDRCSGGSGQAQPGQSKPSFWFSAIRARAPRTTAPLCCRWAAVAVIARSPPAAAGGRPAVTPAVSSGGWAPEGGAPGPGGGLDISGPRARAAGRRCRPGAAAAVRARRTR